MSPPRATARDRVGRRSVVAGGLWALANPALADAGLPPAKVFSANGVRICFYESGPVSGPAVLLCHGFPGLAYSWVRQIPVLAAHGYRVVALDQRGYGRSGRPRAIEAYDIWRLTGDLKALLDHIGVERAVICGHDWGGAVAWQMALLHPERVRGVVSLNTPFAPRGAEDPIIAARRRFGDRMYAVYFQEPNAPDRLLDRDVRTSLQFMMRPPAADAAASRGSILDFAAALEEFRPDPTRPTVLSAGELDYFVRQFSRTGFTGAINWYRNLSRNWATTVDVPQRVTAPALLLLGANDPLIPRASAAGITRYAPRARVEVLEACGHWTQQEQPARAVELMLDWLKRELIV